MFARSLSVPDLVRRFFVSCAQISEAYAARMLMKFGCDWRKIGHKGRCMKGFERTYRKGGRQMVERKAFLKAYNIDEDDFKAADISWQELWNGGSAERGFFCGRTGRDLWADRP